MSSLGKLLLKIKTDDKHDFYIGIDLKDVTSDKKINSVSVIVKSTDGSIDQNYTFTGSNGRYVILGSNAFSQGSSPTTTGINAYSGVEVTITVSWVLWNGGNTFVDLFLIQVPNNGEGPS